MIKEVPRNWFVDGLSVEFFNAGALALVAAVLAVLFLFRAMKQFRRVRYRNRPRPQFRQWPKRDLGAMPSQVALVPVQNQTGDARQSQIQSVIRAEFVKKRIMNFSEYQLFLQLDAMFQGQPAGFRMFPQVPLGGLIESEDREAFFSIMHKRCDFVIVKRNGEPAAVIEYQGYGHFQNNSAQRDEMKRLALKKAGVPTIEVIPDYQWERVQWEIRKELGMPQVPVPS
jgi:Protein of unknown function (DUF2726)